MKKFSFYVPIYFGREKVSQGKGTIQKNPNPKKTSHNLNSAIHKAAGQAFSRQELPPGTVPAAGPIHGLWEFQELSQAKSWNGREP